MPISRYFKGSGEKVMGSMKKEYGEEKGERVFYATANKTGMKPGGAHNAPKTVSRRRKAVGKCTA
jgi:hypothetical protein